MYYFLPSEVAALLTAAYTRNRLHHMFFLASVAHGLRVSEAIGLTCYEVQQTSLHVRSLKDCEQQLQPLHFSDNPIFDERALVIHAGQIQDSALPDKRLFPFCRQRADQLYKYYGKLAGIPRVKCRSHASRHTFCMLVWEESHSLSQVQNAVGHRDQATSLVYLKESDRMKGLVALHNGLEAIATL